MTVPKTATHGLKGKIESIVRAMEALRQDEKEPRNISLREYLQENFKGATPEMLMAELGINPSFTTVRSLMSDKDTAWLLPEIMREAVLRGMGIAQREMMQQAYKALQQQAARSFGPVTSEGGAGGTRWVSPEVFMDPIMRGAVQSVFYPDLVIREITVGNMTVTMPHLDLSDAALAESEEGATIEVGTVTYGSKDVAVRKRAKGIEITYEAIEFNSLDMVALFFEDFGRILGHILNGDAVLALINGDQLDGSEAAAVIGVENTSNGITYKDVVRVWIQMGLLGRNSTAIIGNATTALNYLMLPEVLKTQFPGATAMAQTRLRSPLPTMQDLFLSLKVPGQKMVFVDPSSALVQLTARPLLVESERIVSKQISGTFASIITGFANVQRNARVVVDGSVAFSGAGFPTWMLAYAA
jgi:HK97 family phage major capsid protein